MKKNADTQVYLGLSVLELSKIVTYEFWYDYVQTKYGEKKIMLHATYNFIFYIKTEDVYADIGKDVKKRLDTLNYELDRPLPK